MYAFYIDYSGECKIWTWDRRKHHGHISSIRIKQGEILILKLIINDNQSILTLNHIGGYYWEEKQIGTIENIERDNDLNYRFAIALGRDYLCYQLMYISE